MTRAAKFIGLVAVLALCLTAGATAASQITGGQIKNSTITGKDVRNHSLTKSDFKGSLPRGPQGPQGPAGAGLTSFKTVESAAVDLLPGAVTPETWYATCPAGMHVIGSGFYNSIADIGFVKSYGTFVGGIAFNDTGVTAHGVHLQAICAAIPAGASYLGVSSGKDELARDRAAALANK